MATPPYATVSDLETRLGRELDDAEVQRATSLLETVSVYVDLNVGACVDTIIADYPLVLVDVVCNVALRELAKDPSRDPNAVSVQLGEAAVSYRYEKARGSSGGPLTDDDIATLRRACGEVNARGLASIPLTTTLHDMTQRGYGTPVINLPQPEDDWP